MARNVRWIWQLLDWSLDNSGVGILSGNSTANRQQLAAPESVTVSMEGCAMGVSFVQKASNEELWRILGDVPAPVRLNLVQLAWNLRGIVNPAPEADRSFVSLVRGELIGNVVAEGGLFPIGNAEVVAQFGRYRTTVEQVVGLAGRNVRLARALDVAMKQIDQAIEGIEGLVGSQPMDVVNRFLNDLAAIGLHIARFQSRMDRIRLVDRFGISHMARKLGKSGGQFDGQPGQQLERISVNEVVDVLEAAETARTGNVRYNATDMLDMMAHSEGWFVTAAVHRSASDATQHITVMINGIAGQFHLRVDKSGRLFEISHPNLFG